MSNTGFDVITVLPIFAPDLAERRVGGSHSSGLCYVGGCSAGPKGARRGYSWGASLLGFGKCGYYLLSSELDGGSS